MERAREAPMVRGTLARDPWKVHTLFGWEAPARRGTQLPTGVVQLSGQGAHLLVQGVRLFVQGA
jgi:hypothetical protein